MATKYAMKFIHAFASGLLLSGAVLAIVMICWRLEGKTLVSVQSDSMSPTLKTGDAAVVQSKHASLLRAGQVVAFSSSHDNDVIVSHRIIGTDLSTNSLRTQGDALDNPDPVVPASRVKGQIVAVMPKFGYVLNLFRSTAGLLFLIYIPAAFILFQELDGLRTKLFRKTYRLERA